jgi:hypothetical protein
MASPSAGRSNPGNQATMNLLRLALLAAVVCATGCGESEQQPESSQPPGRPKPTSAEPAPDELDELLALPYAGYVEPGEPDGQQRQGVVVYDAQRSYPGYNLYTVHKRCTAELIDAQGRVVRSWSRPGHYSWGNAELLANGDLLVTGKQRGPTADRSSSDDRQCYLIRFDWSGEVLWQKPVPAHHDVEVTPRDQLLSLTFVRRPVPELHPQAVIKDVELVALDHDGNLVRALSVYDLLRARPDVFPLVRLRGLRDGRLAGRIVDLFHCNSIEWAHHEHLEGRHPLYGPSCVLVCFRHQHRIAVFDWDRAELVWAWGLGELSGPHDAHYLENGNILVYDNGVRRKFSRIIELDPLSGRIVWQYRATPPESFFSLTKGSNQRLPNGNTLIANSDNGEAFEVTREGQIVWRFICPHRNEQGQRATIVRMTRYECSFVEPLLAE